MFLTDKECGGILTEQQKIIQSPGFPEEYQDEQICYWHIRVRLGQKIHLHFLEFDVEEDFSCLSDYLEVYDSYDDVSGLAGRWVSLKEQEIISNLWVNLCRKKKTHRNNTELQILYCF